MSESDVSAVVQKFLTENVRSVEQLEILLLLRATSEQTWTVKEVYARVLTNETSVYQSLEYLCERQLVTRRNDSSYQFSRNNNFEAVLEELAALYKEKPTRVLYALYGPQRSDLNAFARAFKIRKPQ